MSTSFLSRRTVLQAAGAGAASLALPAIGQSAWPSKAIRFVVPFAPGGTSEIVARSVAAELTKQLGQSVFVENKPGGAGVTAMQDVAKATPEQRKAVLAEVESLLGKGKAGMQRHHQQRKAALDVFASDKPDTKAIAALVNTFLDGHDERSKGIAAALTRMHAIFRPEQRKAIASYVAEVMPSPKGKWKQRMGQFWAERMTDRAFDHLQCTPEQRKSLVAIRERVTTQFETMHSERHKHLDGALTLWQAERLDAVAVQGHLDAGRKRAQQMADFAVAQALEVHKVLSPQQRAKLVEFAQKWRGRGHSGGPAGFGGAGGPADGQD